MVLLLLFLAADTTATRTVGDTLWAERTLQVPAGVMVRPRPLRASEPLQALGPPEARMAGDSVRLRYALVAWAPGRQMVTVPGAILIRDDGWSDTLPDWRLTVDVASVLPAMPRDSLAPREAAPEVTVPIRRPRAVVIALVFALAVLLPLHLTWRRRTPVASPPMAPHSAGPEAALLREWAQQGEWTAALEGWRHRLRGMAGPHAAALRSEIEAARFGPVDPGVAAMLVTRAEAIDQGHA